MAILCFFRDSFIISFLLVSRKYFICRSVKMEKAINRRRIIVNVGMCVLATIACIAIAKNSRNDLKRRVKEHDEKTR